MRRANLRTALVLAVIVIAGFLYTILRGVT